MLTENGGKKSPSRTAAYPRFFRVLRRCFRRFTSSFACPRRRRFSSGMDRVTNSSSLTISDSGPTNSSSSSSIFSREELDFVSGDPTASKFPADLPNQIGWNSSENTEENSQRKMKDDFALTLASSRRKQSLITTTPDLLSVGSIQRMTLAKKITWMKASQQNLRQLRMNMNR